MDDYKVEYCYRGNMLFMMGSDGWDYLISSGVNDAWHLVDAEHTPHPMYGEDTPLTEEEALAFAIKLGMTKEAFYMVDSAEVMEYRKRAEDGFASDQFSLGACYSYGSGVPQNHEMAAKWYRKAAEQGHEIAIHRLGIAYEFGTGVKQNYEEAVKWYRKAAYKGYAPAKRNLGHCYGRGFGVEKNFEKAYHLYKEAALEGDTPSQYCLGCCLYDGEGVREDREEAVKWFREAALEGNEHAQYMLASCYENGEGVDKDIKEAIRFYKMAEGHFPKEVKEALSRLGEEDAQDELKKRLMSYLGLSEEEYWEKLCIYGFEFDKSSLISLKRLDRYTQFGDPDDLDDEAWLMAIYGMLNAYKPWNWEWDDDCWKSGKPPRRIPQKPEPSNHPDLESIVDADLF